MPPLERPESESSNPDREGPPIREENCYEERERELLQPLKKADTLADGASHRVIEKQGAHQQSDLEGLASSRGQQFASVSRELLDTFEFDSKNELLRPDDYEVYPNFPWVIDAPQCFDDAAHQGLSLEDRAFLRFFFLGEEIEVSAFQRKFGELGERFVSQALDLEVARLTDRRELELQNLFSHRGARMGARQCISLEIFRVTILRVLDH